MLSENQCEGWLEGYLLTSRHGIFNSYEAFIRIVDSHAKWLKVCRELQWRRDISSLNYVLASHVWQQDHIVHKHYINAHGEDMPEIRNWKWDGAK